MGEIEIPKEFECSITFNIATDPVRVNCQNPSIIKRLLQTSNNTCKGHIFDRLALTAWNRQNPDLICPNCNNKFTEAIPDKDLADRINNEFTKKGNEKLFEKAKKDVKKDYSEMIGKPIILGGPVPEANINPAKDKPAASRQHSNNPLLPENPLSRFFNPPRESDNTKYSKVSQYIKNDNLNLAEKEADGIISLNMKNKSYREISEKFLNKYLSPYNVSRTSQWLHDAIRVNGKIADAQIRNDIYYKIIQRSVTAYGHLLPLEGAAISITSNDKKDKALQMIVEKYISSYLKAIDEGKIQNAIRIAKNVVASPAIKDFLLDKAIKAYIETSNLEKALNLNSSLPSTVSQDRFKKVIALKYVNENFNDKNFQSALDITRQIKSVTTRDSTYGALAEKAARNRNILKSSKAISKVSRLIKRVGLYIKIPCKILVIGLFKIITSPFTLAFLGTYLLFSRLKSRTRRR